ncbi:MAG: L-histidine N(alpha)-methyltransferase [Rhodothermales bacterium]|nr:L-histidine N(alpha)-methyltransferase [Rhodothermales bacterium]
MEASFLNDVLTGLSGSPKSLPSKYFYDATGSALFDKITELEEYYPTRTELQIMRENIDAIGASLGEELAIIEYGSGSSTKTRMILEHIPPGSTYVPIDISGVHLNQVADGLTADYPDLHVIPVHADYTTPVDLPEFDGRRVVYFPGSTIGNFRPANATRFLKRMHTIVGDDGGAIIGVDLKKDPEVLLNAYDDASGVTAEFNLNLLARINRELAADFDLDGFAHRAIYDEDEGRIEMHLVSRKAQTVRVADRAFRFERGEYVHTENSYKYGIDQFSELARGADFWVEQVWTDKRSWFALFLLHAKQAEV